MAPTPGPLIRTPPNANSAASDRYLMRCGGAERNKAGRRRGGWGGKEANHDENGRSSGEGPRISLTSEVTKTPLRLIGTPYSG